MLGLIGMESRWKMTRDCMQQTLLLQLAPKSQLDIKHLMEVQE